VSLKRSGFRIREVADRVDGHRRSKVSAFAVRASLTMFLSVVRVRLIYSPFYKWLGRCVAGSVGFTKVARAQPAVHPGQEKMRRKNPFHRLLYGFSFAFSFTPQMNHAQTTTAAG